MASVRALSHYWFSIQSDLFPWLEEQLGELTENEQRLVTLLDLIRIENFTVFSRNLRGRPKKKRDAIARAFVAKAEYNMPTTRALLDRLACDKKLRRISVLINDRFSRIRFGCYDDPNFGFPPASSIEL